MSQQELLIAVARTLESAASGYFVTGSMASSLQGIPRASHDLDFVVSLTPAGLTRIVEAFPPPRWYLDQAAGLEAIRAGRTFNLIDSTAGEKVDFWPLTGDPFDLARMERRQRIPFEGVNLAVSSPEDTILMKLRWAVLSGGSEKQMEDARSVVEVQGNRLDRAYLERWVGPLGVESLWARLIAPHPR